MAWERKGRASGEVCSCGQGRQAGRGFDFILSVMGRVAVLAETGFWG